MILYLDSSALVKRYVEEEGTDKVDALWDKATDVVTSTVALAECLSAFCRRRREGLFSEVQCLKTISEFKAEYTSFVLVPITPELNRIVEEVLLRHPLRGSDAIHLASALLVDRAVDFHVTFACFDTALNRAAREEGLVVPF